MDSSILENQMDSSIQRGKTLLQQQYNATASAYTSKVAGVLHDITMPTGAALIGNIGKGAVAIARNTGLISAPEGGYVDTMIQKGVSGVVKKGVKQAISKATGSSTDASSASSTSTNASSASTDASSASTDASSASSASTTTATTAEEGDAFVDAGSDIFSNVGSSASSSLFKAVKITTDEDDFADAQSNLASTQSGSVSTSGNTGDSGLSLQGGDEDGVGARMTSTADNSTDLSDAPQGGGGGGGSAGSTGGEEVEDAVEGTAKKAVVEGAETTAETGVETGIESGLASATELSTLFDDVPVAGLAITGALAIGTEIASWFESTPAKKVDPIGVQASQTTGLTTI
jgi:hypothetical protein